MSQLLETHDEQGRRYNLSLGNTLLTVFVEAIGFEIFTKEFVIEGIICDRIYWLENLDYPYICASLMQKLATAIVKSENFASILRLKIPVVLWIAVGDAIALGA